MRVTVNFGKMVTERPKGLVYNPVPWGWQHIPHPDPSVMEIHVMPMSDCGDHAFDLRCQCGPTEDQQTPGFYRHHAYDGREAYESGARKQH